MKSFLMKPKLSHFQFNLKQKQIHILEQKLRAPMNRPILKRRSTFKTNEIKKYTDLRESKKQKDSQDKDKK